MQIISCDMGRSESKFYTCNKQLKFKSIVGDWQPRNLSTGGNYDVEIDYGNSSEKFFIGDLAKQESILPREMTTESKIHMETKILFIVGVSLLIQDNNLTIVTGLPVNLFNQSTKDKLVNLLQGEYTVTFSGFNPKQITIDSNRIIVSPEGAGTYFHEIKKHPELKQGKIRVLNLGSRTINFLTIEDGNFINRSSGTLNYGSITLNNSRINPKEYTRRILADLSIAWKDYNEDDETVLISGGGIINLEPFIKKHFKNTIISDQPIFSDCYGFYDLALAKFGKLVAK